MCLSVRIGLCFYFVSALIHAFLPVYNTCVFPYMSVFATEGQQSSCHDFSCGQLSVSVSQNLTSGPFSQLRMSFTAPARPWSPHTKHLFLHVLIMLCYWICTILNDCDSAGIAINVLAQDLYLSFTSTMCEICLEPSPSFFLPMTLTHIYILNSVLYNQCLLLRKDIF